MHALATIIVIHILFILLAFVRVRSAAAELVADWNEGGAARRNVVVFAALMTLVLSVSIAGQWAVIWGMTQMPKM